MALIPRDEQHRLQIAAGTIGRTRGHDFEKELAEAISKSVWTDHDIPNTNASHRIVGNPAIEIVRYVAADLGIRRIEMVKAWWLGGLATSGLGDVLHTKDGARIDRSKTDVLVSIRSAGKDFVKGVSVKTCSTPKPTNDQLYFTTASAFCALLRRNKVDVSAEAEVAMKMFCGDAGHRPTDDAKRVAGRRSDPERWFWEELPQRGRQELEALLSKRQSEVTRILLQLAYADDPHPPEYLMHLTKPADIDQSDLAIFSMNELIDLSSRYAGFELRPYRVRKGRFRGDPNEHLAPRFGYVQFQRGGQKQHPTQLQFNLQAGYFDKLPK